MVGARRVNAVLVGDNLPELRADLVTALASLDSNLRRGGDARVSGEAMALLGAGAKGGGERGGRGSPRGFFAGEGTGWAREHIAARRGNVRGGVRPLAGAAAHKLAHFGTGGILLGGSRKL